MSAIKPTICKAKNPLTCRFHGLQQIDKTTSSPTTDLKPVIILPTQQKMGEFINGREIIFKTIHGSRLYGLSHEASDEDYYVITSDAEGRQRPRQTIHEGIDTMRLGFNAFEKLAYKGVPQALEAMFSKMTYGDPIEDYRKAYRASDPQVIATYLRTIKSFSLSEQFKRRRHAIRLVMNLNELLETERFNPTLTPEQAILITEKTNKTFDEYRAYMDKISTLQLDWEPSVKEDSSK